MRPGGNRFEFRASSFGFRHCPAPPHVGCYDFMNDFKFVFRQLLKNPGFTAVAVQIGVMLVSELNDLIIRQPAGGGEPRLSAGVAQSTAWPPSGHPTQGK